MELESVVFNCGGLDSISMLGIEFETHENANLLFANLTMESTADKDSGKRTKTPTNVDTSVNCFEPGSSDTILKGGNLLFANANSDPSSLIGRPWQCFRRQQKANILSFGDWNSCSR